MAIYEDCVTRHPIDTLIATLMKGLQTQPEKHMSRMPTNSVSYHSPILPIYQ